MAKKNTSLFHQSSHSKKAQAALEFLTTYGWAFLILGVAIAGLAYLGVFNPSNFVKSTCQFDTGIACPAFNLKNTSSGYVLELQLQNNLADKVKILNLTIADANDKTSFCMSSNVELISGSGSVLLSSYGDKQTRDVRFTFDNSHCFLDSYIGSKQPYALKLYYQKGDSTMPTVTGGRMITTIDKE